MNNLAVTFFFVALYGTYISALFSKIGPNWFYLINFILLPIVLGVIAYLFLRGEVWLKIALVAFIPIFPIAYMGYFVETDGYNIMFLLPLVVTFSVGADIAAILNKLLAR